MSRFCSWCGKVEHTKTCQNPELQKLAKEFVDYMTEDNWEREFGDDFFKATEGRNDIRRKKIKSLLEKQRKDDSQYVSFGCKQLLQAKDKQHQAQREAILETLDKAEVEKWFDMPNTTENWKTWKKIRNTIADIKILESEEE